MEYRALRVIISGGGTGGHIFPAVSIAHKLKEVNPDTEILFVGAEGKMEMEKVPREGFKIIGLPIVGLQRQLTVKNVLNDITVPFRFLGSIVKARKIIKDFKPEVAVGVGGYASAPLLMAATGMKMPCLIQEQNGFAGLTNKMLAKKVQSICVAYEGMEKFFPADRIVMSGNPIRPQIHKYSGEDRLAGLAFYGFSPLKRHILIIGGSLGSGTLNKAMKTWIEAGCPGGEDVEILWQCGKYYKEGIDAFMADRNLPGIIHTDFISRRLQRIGDMRGGQGGGIRAVTQRGGRPPDTQRHGARTQRRRHPGERLGSERVAAQYGARTRIRPRTGIGP